MGHFTTAGKSYPDGGIIDGFADIDHTSFGTSTAPDILNQTAPDSVLDHGATKRFLFWDTGRQLTNRRHVRWTFTGASNWSNWNAVAWYGTPGTNGHDPTIEVDSYWANNGPLTPTAVESVTEAGVPGGSSAWPYLGNDHHVRTEWGDGTIEAKSSLLSPGGATLDFSGLLKLFFGGDTSGAIFDENDNGIPPGGTVTGTVNVTGPDYSFAHDEGGILIASYVTPIPVHFRPRFPQDWLWKHVWPWEEVVDPATLIDIIRERGLTEQIEKVRGAVAVDEIERLVSGAAAMTRSQLKTAVAELRSIVSRGEAGLKSLQAQMGKEQ
jgi:hypothetical protein